MKNLTIFTLYILCFTTVFAQTPDEVKTAKKELKYYKKHINEYIYTKSDCTRKDSVIEEQEVLIEKLTKDINNLNQKLILSVSDKTEVVDTRIMPEGKSFQIQIGVYKNDELTQYLAEPKYMGFELDNDLIRYHLGYFKDYIEAKKFLEIVRRMGIKDAFIAEYLDGKRVNYSSNINYSSPINKSLSTAKTTATTTTTPKNTTNNTKPSNASTTKTTANTSNNSDKVKLQNNWEVKKDENGNDVIMINTKKGTNATNNTKSPNINVIENDESDEDDLYNESIKVKPTVSTTNTTTNPNTTQTNTAPTNTTKPTNTTNNNTNTNVKMEKNWEMGQDDEGNQIIRIMPKKP